MRMRGLVSLCTLTSNMSAYKPEDLEEQGKEEVGRRCSGLRRDLLECLKQSECVSKVNPSLCQ